MSEKKYVTFRDLRSVSPKPETPPEATKTPEKPTSPSTSSTPSISSTASIPSSTSTGSKNNKLQKPDAPAIAPERDFQRIPNSVTRRAIPEGLFRGKSKQVWDYLWSVSRGAVVPVRTVRKSRREIKVGAGLGSMVTVDAALEHLENVSLIAITPSIGSLVGNEYEVFTPEEAATRSTSTTSISSTTSPTQKLDVLDVLDSSISSTTQVVENSATYLPPNTSFKTKEENDDDEAYARFLAAVKKATREITGKDSSPNEAARWEELAEVLITELKIASGRTTVSSVPSFLAEHLRRRLWKKDKRQIEAESANSSTTSPVKNVDAANCPDCSGTGMWYPEGYEKGVARCRHEKLSSQEGNKIDN
jgi:hypothetical protein